MTSRDFCYWLQGYFELSKAATIDKPNTETIKRHLSLVFEHEIDPSIDNGDKDVRKKLQKLHDVFNKKKEITHGHEPMIRC